MVDTPPAYFHEPSSATASLDPENKETVKLTFYTHFFLPRQMAQVLEGQMRMTLGGTFPN
jgi:hypothetical protein